MIGGLALSALYLLATHDAWIEHATCDLGELALAEICSLCELSESIPGGANFEETGRVLTNTGVWEASAPEYAFWPTQRIAAEPSSPRAPPASSQV